MQTETSLLVNKLRLTFVSQQLDAVIIHLMFPPGISLKRYLRRNLWAIHKKLGCLYVAFDDAAHF